MPKCANCRKAEAYETRWEKIRFWIAIHLFPLDFKDERANAFTQGFGDGYKMAGKHYGEQKAWKEQLKASLDGQDIELPKGNQWPKDFSYSHSDYTDPKPQRVGE